MSGGVNLAQTTSGTSTWGGFIAPCFSVFFTSP